MNSLTLVIGSNDGKTVFPGHLGDSQRFHIYRLWEDGRWDLLRTVENTSPEEKHHGGEEKMKAILSLLGEVDLLVSRKNSPNFRKIAASRPIQPVRVRTETVEETLKTLGENFTLLAEMVGRRRAGERFPEIPRLD